MSNNIKVVKLTNGDEVMGNVVWETSEKVTFERPRQVAMVQTGPNSMGVTLIPWLAAAMDSKVVLHTDAFVCDLFDAPDELEKQYIQQTSGIAIASAIQPKGN